MATENELKDIMRKERGGRWIDYYRHTIGTADVYEIWTRTTDPAQARPWRAHEVPQTRFVLEDKNGSKLISPILQTLPNI